MILRTMVGKEIAKKIIDKENPTEKVGETQYGIISNAGPQSRRRRHDRFL